MSLAAPRAPAGDPAAPRAVSRTLVLSVALGTVLNPVNSSMLAVALVPIAHAFGVGVLAASWLVSALYITTAVAQPTWGRICDAGHPKRVFLIGSALVALAGAVAPFAPNLGCLIVVRVLLGLGTAAGYPAALAILRREADRAGGRIPNGALGTLSFTAQATNAFGPALGGVLLALGSWKWVFLFNLPVVAVTCAMGYRFIPPDRTFWRPDGDPATDLIRAGRSSRSRLTLRSLDPVGILCFAGATGLGVAALLNVRADPLVLSGLALGAVVSAVAFVRWERRAAEPFIPLGLFDGNHGLAGTYLRVMLFNTIFYAIYYGWPIWLEQGRGLSPSTTGLVTLPIATVAALATVGATRVSRGRGPRRALLIGSGVLIAALLAMIGLTPYTPLPLLIVVAAALGIPNGFIGVGNQLATYQQAPRSLAGVAAGLQRTSSYIGANIASALVGLTVSASGAKGASAPMHLLAGILAAGATYLFLRVLATRSLSSATVAVP
jgi:MFS family permease